MARVKRGVTTHARHKKVLALAKGYRGRGSTAYRVAIEKVEKALRYAYRDRRNRKRDFRALWIQRINAGAREHGLTYSQFMHGIKLAGLDVGEHLAVEIEAGQLDAMHKLRVGQTMLARTGIDPLNPQGTKIPLAVTPVAIGVTQCLFDLLDRNSVSRAATAAVALGEVEDLLVPCVGCDPAFNARHGSSPQIRQIGQNELGVALLQGRRAAPQPFALF